MPQLPGPPDGFVAQRPWAQLWPEGGACGLTVEEVDGGGVPLWSVPVHLDGMGVAVGRWPAYLAGLYRPVLGSIFFTKRRFKPEKRAFGKASARRQESADKAPYKASVSVHKGRFEGQASFKVAPPQCP